MAIEIVFVALSVAAGALAVIVTFLASRKSFPDMLIDLQGKADKYRAQIRAIERLLEANNEKKP